MIDLKLLYGALNHVKKFIMNHKIILYVGSLLAGYFFISIFLSIIFGQMNEIRKNGEIIFLTRNAPTTYFRDKDGEWTGLEYEMAIDFAKFLKVKPIFRTYDTVANLLKALKKGEGDVAVSGLSATKMRKKHFHFGPTYQTITQNFICSPNVKISPLKEAKGLNILIIQNGSYLEILEKIKEANPDFNYKTVAIFSTEELLKKVDEGEIECTVADSNIFEIQRHLFPYLKSYPISKEKSDLRWAFARHNRGLKKDLAQWFESFKKSGKLKTLIDKYYGHLQEYDPYDSQVFLEKIQTILPKYELFFREAGEKYNISWTFLAAISYQESHWNPKAESPTGVRGLMMLTQKTAEQLKIQNRLDPEQSIDGGARYIKHLIERIPDYITGEDRIWMALASYNLGFSHLQDARALTLWEGKNPNKWGDIQNILPLLSQNKYFKKVPFGYARGMEALVYVRRVKNYHNILKQNLSKP